jgi:hypothetical protein
MKTSKMTNTYIPVTLKKLEEMSPEELLSQYQSLVDFIKERKGIPFERNPQIPREKLIELVTAGQMNYFDDIERVMLAESLSEWGKRRGLSDKPILYIGGDTSVPCQTGGQI